MTGLIIYYRIIKFYYEVIMLVDFFLIADKHLSPTLLLLPFTRISHPLPPDLDLIS